MATDPDGGTVEPARYFIAQPDVETHFQSLGVDFFAYRCFIPAQGHSIEFLSAVEPPWWLIVLLLGTGFALKWRYARRLETR